jgi:hypothetical protein
MKAHSVASAAIRREPVASGRAGLQRAILLRLSQSPSRCFLSAHAFDFLALLNPVLSRTSQALVKLCSITNSREMGVWRAATLTLRAPGRERSHGRRRARRRVRDSGQ